MTALVWDQMGERTYQAGVDRGVLYLQDGSGIVWNGLTSVQETSTDQLKSFYLDGVKYLDNVVVGDYSGKLNAYTYPEEFDLINGIVDVAPGLSYYDQPVQSFGLSYRTGIGSDIDPDLGYMIHLLYNLVAVPDPLTMSSLDNTGKATEFVWTLSATPPPLENHRPTAHISIDSRDTPASVLSTLEGILYGTDTSDPHLPSIVEISELFGYLGALIIVDHGDGTWSAIDESDTYITMLSDTEFQIDGANATYLDATTYTISSTNAS